MNKADSEVVMARSIEQERRLRTGSLSLKGLGLKSVSPNVSELNWLEKLDVSENQIEDIQFVSSLTNLITLDARSCKINELSGIESLSKLESLNLSQNGITEISLLDKLSALKYLSLGGNRIKNISSLNGKKKLVFARLNNNVIKDLRPLKNCQGILRLELSSNQITDMTALSKLSELRILDCSRNRIKRIPENWCAVNLKVVNLAFNQFSRLQPIYNSSQIESLNLRYNHINDINGIASLQRLNELNLGHNHISDLSHLKGLEKLEFLDVSYNDLSSLNGVETLKELERLDARYNQIEKLHNLEDLQRLVTLNLSFNRVISLVALAGMKNLTHIYLSGNKICSIDPLQPMDQLVCLKVRHNELETIDTISYLKNLKIANFSHNLIKDIQPIVPMLKRGSTFSLSIVQGNVQLQNNPITTPPKSILSEGRDAIINWFDQVEEQGEAPLFEAKLMILGQGGAGKTTFANLQLNPHYEVNPGVQESTLGVSVYNGKTFPHSEHREIMVIANIWDFGGQEIQKMLHQFFITEDCLYVIVSDKRAENTNFDYWFQIINLLGANSKVIVLENPKETTGVNEDFALNKYRELFGKLDIECIEVNLKETRGKDKLKWMVLNEICSKRLSELEIVNRAVPKRWKMVRTWLQNAHKRKYVALDSFYRFCTSKRVNLTTSQADLCLHYLRGLGEVVYFKDRELATDIFLDHNWLTSGMYYILSDIRIKENKGQFTRQDAYEQWGQHGYSESEKAMLLNLLLKDRFDICYEVPLKKDVFITPLLLPNDKPDIWGEPTTMRFRYQYGFIPHGLFSRLIVRLHEKIDGELRWKSGVRLVESFSGLKVKAEVQLYVDPDENKQVIDIALSGATGHCKELLRFIRTSLDGLHKEFNNLKFSEVVSCNCDTCKELMTSGQKPSFYEYNKLQLKIQNRSYFEECPNSSYQPINIGQILGDIVVENAASASSDNELFQRLSDLGVSINQIKSENHVQLSNVGNSTATASASAHAELSVALEGIKNISKVILEDISDELENNQHQDSSGLVKQAKSDLLRLEDEVSSLSNMGELSSTSRFTQFRDELMNPESSLRKTISKLRRGKNYLLNIAEAYNDVASHVALPLIPPGLIKAGKRL